MNVSSKLVVWMVVSLSPSSGAFNLPPPAYRNSPSSSSSIISSRSSSAVEVVASPPSRWSTRRPGTTLSSSASVAPCADGNNNNSNNNNSNSNSPAVVVASASSSTDGDADATTTATPTTTTTATLTKQQKRARQIRREGGMFAFDTKFGALNPFAIYYGLVSIALGLVWFAALTACDLLYRITGGRVDRNRRVPVFLSHAWGTLLMLLTGCFPKVENGNIVREFHKSGRKAMFVSNHNSWMDIPFLGHAIGWHNYKFIAKKELEKVPILGKAIKCGKNVLVDRTDRKSQLMTLKQGIKWLDDGVNLCTFPEGTRSRSGRLMPFKNGAFKMAHKAGAPVIPVSIAGAAGVMPSHWMFPYRPAGFGACRIVVHEPVESAGRTEEELASAVRDSIVGGLPEDQRPLAST